MLNVLSPPSFVLKSGFLYIVSDHQRSQLAGAGVTPESGRWRRPGPQQITVNLNRQLRTEHKCKYKPKNGN